jgi:plastocyanin
METQTSSRPAKGFLVLLGFGGILLVALVAAELAVPLQPPLSIGGQTIIAGEASVAMPANAAVVGFTPRNITVVIGVNNTIVWTNEDTIVHTVYSKSVPVGSSSFNSTLLSHGDTFEVTLNVTGVYDYYCSIHPATMTGSVTVKGGIMVYILPGTANKGLNYSPDNLTVVVGFNNTVTFINEDTSLHTVTSDDGTSFNSGDIAPGSSWTFTFIVVGTFGFHCTYHPSFMKGSITVMGQPIPD